MSYLNILSNCLWRYGLRLMALMSVIMLAGCTILPESPISQVYLLPASSSPSVGGPELGQSLRIVQPNTSQFLNGSRIAVQPQGSEITIYSGSRWSDPTAVLVRNRLIQEFRTVGRFAFISSDDDNLQVDYELSGDLSSFQTVYTAGQGEVVIRFDARLVRLSDRRAIATRSFVVRQPIDGSSMDHVVAAFGAASDQFAAQMVVWTQQQVVSNR